MEFMRIVHGNGSSKEAGSNDGTTGEGIQNTEGKRNEATEQNKNRNKMMMKKKKKMVMRKLVQGRYWESNLPTIWTLRMIRMGSTMDVKISEKDRD